MSILDSFDPDEMARGLETAGPVINEIMSTTGLNNLKLVELLKQGLTTAQILDVPADQLEKIFALAAQQLARGDIAKARDLCWMLCQLHPFDERFTYGLATTYHLEGDFAKAARLYLLFLSMDATSFDGRMRLAECLLAAREYNEALEMFRDAASQAKADGDSEKQETAIRMAAYVEVQRDGKPVGNSSRELQ